MLCVTDEHITRGILATALIFLCCKSVAMVYKTKYYYAPILVLYCFSYQIEEFRNVGVIVHMLNALFLTWTLYIMDKIASTVFSNVFFTMVFVYTLRLTV